MSKTMILLFILIASIQCNAQNTLNWNGKKCAVVLTYDDALNVHLDKVIPQLNAYNFKGTFYLIGSSPNVANRINEWRAAAAQGHELGNHTLNHPCDGSMPGREWTKGESDLTRYSVQRATHEIKICNTLLEAIDGKKERTFAYPCGDLKIRDTLFYKYSENEFACARGVETGYLPMEKVDLSNVNAFIVINSTAEEMIAQVVNAEKAGSFIVFLFHGVGGEHHMNVELEEHRKLLEYLKNKEKDIWVATMVDVAKYISEVSEK